MKRMWIAVGLVAAITVTSCICLFTLMNLKDDFCREFDELYALNAAGDSKATAEAAKKLTDLWVDKSRVLCRIVRHAQLDNVTLAVARLEPLAIYGERGEFAAEISRCKILLEDICDSEKPLLRNIF